MHRLLNSHHLSAETWLAMDWLMSSFLLFVPNVEEGKGNTYRSSASQISCSALWVHVNKGNFHCFPRPPIIPCIALMADKIAFRKGCARRLWNSLCHAAILPLPPKPLIRNWFWHLHLLGLGHVTWWPWLELLSWYPNTWSATMSCKILQVVWMMFYHQWMHIQIICN